MTEGVATTENATAAASSDPESSADPAPPVKSGRAFVHLAHGFGAATWQEKWDRGEIIGLNEHLPYGFFRAREHGFVVEYSEDRPEGWLGFVFRLAVRFALGFDLVHAWRNRLAVYAADVVWTGTESQYLAVLLLLRVQLRRDRPKVIAQTIWLFDSWARLPLFRRLLYRRLVNDAAVLTTHSEAGVEDARKLFPRQRALFMPYGIVADRMASPGRDATRNAIRVLSAGHDRHRDWTTLIAALRDRPEVELRIVARRLPGKLQFGCNVSLVHPATNDEYLALYRWADVVALSLFPNRHGSGITVIEEATVLGVPVVATDAGGLRGYFSDQEIRYVPVADPAAMRAAIKAVADDVNSPQMVERAQQRMVEAGLTSRDFARRHAQLSRELLVGAEPTAIAAGV